jgi:hypothetical protein
MELTTDQYYNINEVQFNLQQLRYVCAAVFLLIGKARGRRPMALEEIDTEIESLSDDELLVLRRLCLECSARQNTIATLAKQVIQSRGHHVEEE